MLARTLPRADVSATRVDAIPSPEWSEFRLGVEVDETWLTDDCSEVSINVLAGNVAGENREGVTIQPEIGLLLDVEQAKLLIDRLRVAVERAETWILTSPNGKYTIRDGDIKPDHKTSKRRKHQAANAVA